MAATYPFLFLGQGDCGYFEWASLLVLFAEEPPAALRNKLVKGVPEPYTDSVGWEGPLLHVGSGQFVNVDIASSYEADAGDEPEESDFLGMIASSSQIERFHADIERWLRELGAAAEIVGVVKPEDGEAGGTEPGEWHLWSVKRASVLLERFAGAAPAADSYTAEMLSHAIDMVIQSEGEDAVPEVLRRWADEL
jgi:hypothetical protein